MSVVKRTFTTESESARRSSKPFITLDRVTIRLRDRFVFENTSWRIQSDEQWAVIGPNGAGKSTLVKAIAGELPVVQGRAIYHFMGELGLAGAVPDGHVARVAFDTERAFYNSKMRSDSFGSEQDGTVTVAETLLWGSSPSGAGRHAELRQIARKLGIEHLLGRAAHVLSYGEAKLLLLARALLRSPNLLILDEPFEGLDGRAKADLKTVIDSLMGGPMRILLVSHRFEEISTKVTHVLCVKGCSVIMQGPAKEILQPVKISRIYGRKGLAGGGKELTPRTEEAHASAPQEVVRMRDTTVRFGGQVVLDHVNWTVQRGENWAVLGPNGAGKSTILELITGDNVQGYANDIRLFGRKKGSGETVWEIKEKLSLVSAEFQLKYQKGIPAYDVICSGFFDSIGLFRRCTDEQHRAARDWMGLLGMADLARKRFDHLSHGQQRLILLARAMVKSPVLLILDEPCDGLDYANRRLVLDCIGLIGSRTATDLIYVTHHKNELPPCITHALILNKGKVEGVGRIDEHEGIRAWLQG